MRTYLTNVKQTIHIALAHGAGLHQCPGIWGVAVRNASQTPECFTSKLPEENRAVPVPSHRAIKRQTPGVVNS